MDPIKNQISAIDPLTIDPVTEPNGEEALHKILSGSTVFSDSRSLAGVTSLETRRRRKAQIAGGLLLGAAAVTAGVLVASNFGTVSSTPAPATTVTEATPTPSASATATPTATPSATPTATPTPSATPTATPTSTSTPTPSATTAAPPVQAPTLKTFTFPDGHLSFTYPAGWTVTTEQGGYISEATKAGSVGATIFDASGSKVAIINSGMYGDGAGGLVKRTVLDSAPIPGLASTSRGPAYFAFLADAGVATSPQGEVIPRPASDADLYYSMDLRPAEELKNEQMPSGSNQMGMPNGTMNAYVVLDHTKGAAFASQAAAKAWMGTTQYAQLKAMLLSLSYK